MFVSLSPPPHCSHLSLSTVKHQHLIPYTCSLFPSISTSRSTYSYSCTYNAAIAVAAATSTTSSSSSSAIKRISDKLRYFHPHPEPDPDPKVSAGEIFIPTPHDVPIDRVGSTIDSTSTTPLQVTTKSNHEIRPRKETLPSLAELTLPAQELRRLRTLGIRLRHKLRVGKAGITEGIVNGIHERWSRSEVVKIKCDDLCRINMKRTHQILEVLSRVYTFYGARTVCVS